MLTTKVISVDKQYMVLIVIDKFTIGSHQPFHNGFWLTWNIPHLGKKFMKVLEVCF